MQGRKNLVSLDNQVVEPFLGELAAIYDALQITDDTANIEHEEDIS